MKINLFSNSTVNFNSSILIYRILVAASLFVVHGFKKIKNFDADVTRFPDPVGFGPHFTFFYAIFAILICPLLIMLGLFTRAACLGVLSVTLSGLFLVHIHDPLEIMDTPYIYSVSMFLILLTGPGKYSIDARVGKNT